MSKHELNWQQTGHSGVTHICWLPEGEQLWVAYGSGNIYRFMGVPKRWYDDLKKAASPTKYVRGKLSTRFEMRKIVGDQFKPKGD